jgi:hypothetical protein
VNQILLGSQVLLGGLDRRVAQEQLNLLKFPVGRPAELRCRAETIVRRDARGAGRGGIRPEHLAYDLYMYAFIVKEDMPGKKWWRNVYEDSEWPNEDGVAESNDAGVSVIGLSSDLASLADSSAVDSLADRFRELVKAHGGIVA